VEVGEAGGLGGATLRGAALAPSNGPVQIPVRSSAINEATYTPEGGVLTITFQNGQVYTYEGVPPDVVVGFASAASQGAYYDARIKGKF
jgi:hypothetical protein